MPVRVRYAPSPTGSPHVGNIRTALYNYLFARRHGGTMLLRIEDTDTARTVPGCEAEIIESLDYVGIEWDAGPGREDGHGPYRQSERKAQGVYEPVVARLLEEGGAYWAFDTPEELQALRQSQQEAGGASGYFGGQWRDASPAQAEAARAAGLPGVVRLRVPRGTKIAFDDAIRGRIEVDADVVDDPVLVKADGMPTYHFAAMVDDHLMGVTHVFRGEEWLSSAPKHVVLLQALGWDPPVFVHLPVIKGKDGSKLSKRHGDTACLDFRRAGFLGDALANFIALIGWSPGDDREAMSMAEMAEAFDIPGIQPSSGVFDMEKLLWMDGHYIRSRGQGQLVQEVLAYANSQEAADYWLAKGDAGRAGSLASLAAAPAGYAAQAIGLLQPRCETLADFGPGTAFFFADLPEADPAARDKWLGEPHVPAMFREIVSRLDGDGPEPDEAGYEALLRSVQAGLGLEKLGPVVHPVRVALTGTTAGPGLFELMAVLGRARVARRLRACLPG